MRKTKEWGPLIWSLAAMLFVNAVAFGDDHKVRRVLVISIDGMHALDMALWVKNNPNSALGKLSAQGLNFTNASTTRPSMATTTSAPVRRAMPA